MPCDSVITNSVNLALANGDILRAALEAMGAQDLSFTATGARFILDGAAWYIDRGQLNSTRSAQAVADMANRIKRAYSTETVNRAAKRFGWTVKKTGANANKMTLTRR